MWYFLHALLLELLYNVSFDLSYHSEEIPDESQFSRIKHYPVAASSNTTAAILDALTTRVHVHTGTNVF